MLSRDRKLEIGGDVNVGRFVSDNQPAQEVMNISFRLFLILTFILIGRPQDFFKILEPFRIALVFTILTLTATLLRERISFSSLLQQNREVRLYTLFYLVMILTIPFSIYKGKAFNYVFLQYSPRLLFFYLLVVHITTFDKLIKLISTIAWSTLFYGTMVIILGWGVDGRVAYGTVYDANDLAYFMVSLAPLALLLWVSKTNPAQKIRGAATFLVAVLLAMLTQSRGGFVGLAAVLGLLIVFPDSGLKKNHRTLILLSMLAFFAIFGARIMERLQTFSDIETDYNITDEFGRIAIWKRGIRIVLENPLSGVGASCFPMALGDQRQSEGIVPRWQASHNSYLQVIAETGLIGFLVFMALIVTTYKNLRPAKIPDPTKSKEVEANPGARLIQYAFIGNLVCAFFLTQGYSIIFPLFFGISAAKRQMDLAMHTAPERTK